MSSLRLALVQLAVCIDQQKNLERILYFVERAKQQQADVIVFPEGCNMVYSSEIAKETAEPIPGGECCVMFMEAAKQFSMYIVAGTILESDNGLVYNTTTVWNPEGVLIAKYRKVHMFDIDIKEKFSFFESETTSPGDSLATFEAKGFKFGLGICCDIKFEEMARLHRKMGCHVLLYPGIFNMITGPLHWSLLQRSRANDNQCYVAGIAPSRDLQDGAFPSWGHTQLTSPWGEVLHDLDIDEGMIVADLDMSVINEVRNQIPVFNQRRTDLYDTIWKKQL